MSDNTREKIRDIEGLVTFDIGGRGTIKALYESAMAKQGDYPILLAAKTIRERLGDSKIALICTGFQVPPTFIQETDGPIGAISLARGLNRLCNANSIIVAEARIFPILQSVAYASGLNVVRREDLKKAKHAVALEEFPLTKSRAGQSAQEILEQYEIGVAVAIEKAGWNDAGVYHNMKGLDISKPHSRVEVLFEEAKRRGIPTIGIGDGGNEVGMGKIRETVKAVVPFGSKCACPCGRGIAADFDSDILVTATVSNWGAHAIVAALSVLAGADFLHTPEMEENMLRAAAKSGAIDAIGGWANGDCDGISLGTHASIVRMVREIMLRA